MDRRNVLFVDDEAKVLSSIKRSVMDEDYSSFFATSGEKALEILESEEISVIVTDMKMPNMNGLELLKKTKEISPNTVRMVLSGYTQLPQVLATVNFAGIFKFITKPWQDDEEFLPFIREAIDYYNLKKESEKLRNDIEHKNTMYKNMLNYSNDILKNINIDVNNLKKINKLILDFQKNLLDKLKENQININFVDHYIALINSVYFDFLNTIPSKNEKFNIEQFAEALKTNHPEDLGLEIDKPNFIFEGNYSLIMTTLEILLKQILNQCDITAFRITVTEIQPFIIKFEFDKEVFRELFSKDLDLKMTIKILTDIFKLVGEKIHINITDGGIIVNTNLMHK